jgi:hypothetical protein
MEKKNKLLICVSQNDNSEAALKFAALKAKKNNYLIEILSVIDTSCKEYGLFSVGEIITREKLAKSESYLKNIIDKLYEWSNITPIVNLRNGYISDEILNTLKQDKSINLIIIGTSKKSSTKGKLLTYLTEKLYSTLTTPIIIIPNNLDEKAIEKII